MSQTDKLLLLLQRPQESIALPKGNETKTQFLVPPQYLKESFRPFASELLEKSSENADEYVVVRQIAIPSLGNVMQLGKEDAFSLFFPKHQEYAAELLDLFLAVENIDDLLSVAVYVRERVNPYLFQYAFSVALLHRPDTKHLQLPSMLHSFPEKFFHSKVMNKAREYGALVPNEKRKPLESDKFHTASRDEQEQLLHYFREDIGVNLHHWTWHLVYPTRGPQSIINKDRRGELFYFMHRQILARYDFERLSNNLRRTVPFTDLDGIMEEAYFPKLDRMLTNRSYPPRMPNQRLQNLRRANEGLMYEVSDLKRYRDLILASIEQGYVVDEYMNPIPLTELRGIDILGNMIESTALSPNEALYGNIHNIGHSMISLVHDPDGRHLEQFSVMGGTATAMRDPMFYRWHGLMELIFSRFKDKLPKYTEQQLNFPGIVVGNIGVKTPKQPPNILRTFWSKSDVNIANGIDFTSGGELLIRFLHLQHADFMYNITIFNNTNTVKQGTCRIFMSPKYDEDGKEWEMNVHRKFLIELDKFRVILKPGENAFQQSSVDSSVTIPFEQTYRDVGQMNALVQYATRFCGCGWPHNLLIPRGKPEGMPCTLFVMVSDYELDKVIQDVPIGQCKDAISFCGLKDKMYPDRRSMGFPFDRVPRHGVKTLKDFMTPNMNVGNVSIIFEDKIYINETHLKE